MRVGTLPVRARFSYFNVGEGAGEYHVVFTPAGGPTDADRQLALLDEATRLFPSIVKEGRPTPVWRRFFLGDPVNRYPFPGGEWPAAETFIGQYLPGGERAVAWGYYVDGATVSRDGNATIMHRSLEHHYYTGLHAGPRGDEEAQTRTLFRALHDETRSRGIHFAGEMARIWVHVNDIDNRYAGMVTARRKFFEDIGLTPDTHYIASTGIEGKSPFPGALVCVDAYAVKGLLPGQLSYLRASDFLSRADRYGVTFERGTVIAHGDRARLLISGTASIDKHGELLFPLQVVAQARRAMQNIDALLREGGAAFTDLTHAIVYLRDAADYPLVRNVISSSWPLVPTIYAVAPVCRPGWLVEIECSAIVARDAAFPPF